MHHPAALTLRSCQGNLSRLALNLAEIWRVDLWIELGVIDVSVGCAVIEFAREGCALCTVRLPCSMPHSTANLRSLAPNLSEIESVHFCMSLAAAREARTGGTDASAHRSRALTDMSSHAKSQIPSSQPDRDTAC